MRYRIVSRKEPLIARRAQWDNESGVGMISNAMHLVQPDVGRHREWPKAIADRLLPLAAAPTFATLALLTCIQDGGMQSTLCSAAHNASPFTGMVLMYLLMSAFHLAPWLKLVTNLREGA